MRTLLVKRAATQLRCDKVQAQYQDFLKQLQQVQESIKKQEQQEALVKVRDTTTIPPPPPLQEVDSILQQLGVSLSDEQVEKLKFEDMTLDEIEQAKLAYIKAADDAKQRKRPSATQEGDKPRSRSPRSRSE